MADTAKKAKVDVVSMTDEHADAAADFFRAVGWSSDATGDQVRRSRKLASDESPFFPGEDIPTVLFLSDGQALGYVSSIPLLVWNAGQEQRAEWIKGLMVLPEHRNGPIGALLVKNLLRRLQCPLSLVVGTPARRLFEAFGLVDLGLVPNYLRLLNTSNFLRKLDPGALGVSVSKPLLRAFQFAQKTGLVSIPGVCADRWFRLKAAFATSRTRSLRLDTRGAFPDRSALDRLWHSVCDKIKAAPVRNGSYLASRYATDAAYRAVSVYDGANLAGFAVVRGPREEGDPRLKGIRIASLSDLLFPPDRPDVASAVLRGSDVVAHSLGADALLCSASHPAVLTALARQAYLRVPPNLHLMIPNPKRCNLSQNLSDWWVTRGDSNADEVF